MDYEYDPDIEAKAQREDAAIAELDNKVTLVNKRGGKRTIEIISPYVGELRRAYAVKSGSGVYPLDRYESARRLMDTMVESAIRNGEKISA